MKSSMRTLIKRALTSDSPLDTITISGWVRTRRDSKEFSFLEMNDGSCLANIQCIADAGIPGYDEVQQMTTGSSGTQEYGSF